MAALIVDDDPFARSILRRHLTTIGFDCLEAETGQGALEVLGTEDHRIDVILLDRTLPDMTGLDVMAALRTSPAHGYIPVILQTAADRLEDVRSGLAAGCFAYLTKPVDRAQVRALAGTAARLRDRYRSLQREVASREGGLRHLRHAEFVIRSPAEANDIAVSLGIAVNAPGRNISFGVLELLLNAIEHGNLGIGSARKQALLEEGALAEEIERRLAEPARSARSVSVRYERGPDGAVIRIEDDGDGFDWRAYAHIDLDHAFHAHGRGIAMARMLSFDALEYEGRGNVVVARVNLA
ncbi:response regulator [Azospirillum sp. sgz302134]